MFKMIHYCWHMYLRTFEVCALKYMSLIALVSYYTRFSMTSNFKKGQIKIRLSALTDISMSLMIENDTRGGICHSIY